MELTEAMEDYLRAIYELEQTESPVATSAVARRMEVAPSSATGMLKRLASMALVMHQPYVGVRLTPSGRKAALEVIRHHRLIETFLAEAMGLSWDQVHQEAHRLEHHLSEELEDRMAELLGHPQRDPHGAPIPPKTGSFRQPRYGTLAEAEGGQRVVIRQVLDDDPARLRYLGDLGLRPEVEIQVLEVGPFEGPVVVQTDTGRHALGRELAQRVLVEVVE